MCKPSVSNVIYHEFSHGAAFCTLNGKNVNVMLELIFTCVIRMQYVSSGHKVYLSFIYHFVNFTKWQINDK